MSSATVAATSAMAENPGGASVPAVPFGSDKPSECLNTAPDETASRQHPLPPSSPVSEQVGSPHRFDDVKLKSHQAVQHIPLDAADGLGWRSEPGLPRETVERSSSFSVTTAPAPTDSDTGRGEEASSEATRARSTPKRPKTTVSPVRDRVVVLDSDSDDADGDLTAASYAANQRAHLQPKPSTGAVAALYSVVHDSDPDLADGDEVTAAAAVSPESDSILSDDDLEEVNLGSATANLGGPQESQE